MGKPIVYLLVRDEPFGFGETLGMLRRQSLAGCRMVAVTPPGLGAATEKLIGPNFAERIVALDEAVGAALNGHLAQSDADVAIVLDGAYLPSTTVWLERLVAPLENGEADITLSRMVHDLYTNWLVQNDFRSIQHLADRSAPSPFLFLFGAFAFKTAVAAKKPFPDDAGYADAGFRWRLTDPGTTALVADATVSHLFPIGPAEYAAAHRRYARSCPDGGGPFAHALRLAFGGFVRDLSLIFSRRAPQWLPYAVYFRTRLFLGVLFGGNN